MKTPEEPSLLYNRGSLFSLLLKKKKIRWHLLKHSQEDFIQGVGVLLR